MLKLLDTIVKMCSSIQLNCGGTNDDKPRPYTFGVVAKPLHGLKDLIDSRYLGYTVYTLYL